METLSEKEITLDIEPYIIYKGKYVKDFVKNINARISNQMRIHWKWLKNQNSEEISKYIKTIINNQAGEKLKC